MKTRKWVIIAITLLLVTLATVSVAAAGGRQRQIERGTGTRVIGQTLASEKPYMPWTLPNNPMGLDDSQKPLAPTPRMPVTWKEGFEYAWPNATWSTFDNNGGVDLCWNDVSYRHYKGGWSGWPAAGCADGYFPPGYDNDMDSWMTLGPFSTSGAKSGKVSFRYWLDSEPGFDYLWFCAAPEYYAPWYCYNVSGWSANKWVNATLNLKNVPGYGNMLGNPQVWVGWIFSSDGSLGGDVGYEGAYVDEIVVTIK
jgi:hypothetical protein